ncbi:hypothetical protein PVAND_008160 [Polypedilum vanderplanki]|uniref:Uncharacterized protein n=1 Tax=Polypedilum vanderplanki TaxID=319348 RepID=A0A9J6C8L9_POLVA|nr:hypothetical protein PVAND_008160 [Polypedilum vanderplanki]
MDILKRKFLLSVLTFIICYNINKTIAQNLTTITIKPLTYHVPIIPIINTSNLGPKKFERIIVPTYPINDSPKNYSNEKKKFGSEKREKEPEEKKVKPKINSKNYDDRKGNSYKTYSYVNRDDDHKKKIPTETKPNDIQPLHIKTRDFKAPQPEIVTESSHDKKKKVKEQQEKLKIENLPENPFLVPETNWWDNTAKYNYGIIHDNYKGLEEQSPKINKEQIISHEDAREDESKEEVVTPVVTITEPITQIIHHEPQSLSPPVKFKSNFKDPNMQPQVHPRVDNPGRFLYKTQVYYPNYRDHLYLPVTTYYGNHQGLAKVFPVFNSHSVYHNSPHHSTSVAPPTQHHHQQHHNSIPHKPQRTRTTPPTVNSKKTHPTVITPQKRDPNQKPNEKPVPPPPSKEEAEEDYDYDEEEEGENDGSNDKQEGESAEEEDGSEGNDYDDDEEEEEEDEKPKYRYASFRNNDSNESDEDADQFDLAWKKYGYGPKTKHSEEEDDDSYESSESQIVPERRKIVHMKMEYYSTPHKDTEEELVEAASNVEKTVIVNDPKKETEAVDVVNKKMNKKKKKNKNVGKSQDQHPNAGPDDLKFFQDIFIEKKSPHEIEFGHVSETPKGWEERYERQNHSHDKNRHQGKVLSTNS